MKQKISYNSIVSGLTITFLVIFVAIFVLFWVFVNQPFDNVFFWILFGLFCVGIIWACGSIPSSVYDDDDYIVEKKPFSSRRYRYSDIKSASVADASQYGTYDRKAHFHGKYKYPVLLTLKDGSQEIIGSENPTELVEYINSRVS